jgi:DNA polymerase III subunit delta
VKIQASQLPSSLTKTLFPCYLVTGDEPLLVEEARDAIRAGARERGFTMRESHVAAPGFDWAELAAAGANLSLFADRRILELHLPTGKPGVAGATAIIELLPQCGPDLLFVVSAPKLDRAGAAAKWSKAIEARGALVPIYAVSAGDLPRWIETRMRQAGLAPERDAAGLLAERVEGNLLAAAQEIEKLRLLHGAGAVQVADVENAVADSSRYDVYKLVDAALAGDARRALRILGGIRAEGLDAVIVNWALARELRMLIRIADSMRSGVPLAAALQKERVWPSRQAIVRASMTRHAAPDLYGLLQAVAHADAAAKGRVALDPWQLTAGIVVRLATGAARAA